MASQKQMDGLFMDIAVRTAMLSKAVRTKVGAALVTVDEHVTVGWNGTPPGDDNCCEIEQPDGTLVTKPEVVHAEINAIIKHGQQGSVCGTNNATLYVTLSPCVDCAKLIARSGIRRVLFRDLYRITDGVDFLRKRGIDVIHMPPE